VVPYSAPTLEPPPAPPPVPRHLAERIISSRGALEGERKQVTVLFADLKGSTALIEGLDPEDARRVLDPVLKRMVEAVHRYEGTVNMVMGDGIMALFGAPLAHEDHAVRACYAALRLQESVQEYAEEVFRREGVRLQVRVGLNSGDVVVRSIDSDLHMDYTAVGQTTHLAARMEQMATPGSILLAPDTVRLAEAYLQLRPLGPVPVRGMGAPVAVYELLGSGPTRTRLQAAAAKGLTRFVGRDAELALLRRTLERAGAGHGQVVAIVGEAGVGKSRLVWELTHSPRTEGWLVLHSSSMSYGKATSYLPVIDLLKSYCDVNARDDARRIREKLTGKLLALDPALQPTLPDFLRLLDAPVEDPAWQALDPPQRRQHTLDACKRLLLRESQEQPLLLVFEDLHWIDGETQALLDSLVEVLPAARVMLLVNYRPEYEHGWGRKTYYHQVQLDPLPAESADELLDALLGDDAELQPLKRLLTERTEGNPFFLEESVRTLEETGALVGERGAYRLAGPLQRIEVPATVQAVLAARIDRLAPEDKRLLQAAAVVGKDVPYSLLQAAAELSEDALRQGLARLQAAEFLYETSLFPDLEYTFNHALTHEVAYGSLLQDRRRALHARIVAAIERLYPDRLAEHVERLAHHAFRGALWEQAARYSRQAGEKADSRSAHEESAGYFEQALQALDYLPESRETLEMGIDLRFELRHSLYPRGEVAYLLRRLREAEALAETLGDQRRAGWLGVFQSNYHWLLGEHHLAVEAGERALASAAALDDSDLRIAANLRLGQARYALGDYQQPRRFFEQNVDVLNGDPSHRFGTLGHPSVIYRSWLLVSLSELGEFEEGQELAARTIRLAESVGQPFTLGVAYWGAGHLYLRQGDVERAIPLLERGLEICRASDIEQLFRWVAPSLSHAYAFTGRLDEAVSLAEQAVERAAAGGHRVLQSGRLAVLSHVYLLAGRVDDARRCATEALALAQAQDERGMQAWIARILAEMPAPDAGPEDEQAEAQFRQALALAERLGMRPLVAHCHLGLGTLYQEADRPEDARAELAAAAELYGAMGMPSWQAHAETAALAAPR
jgi:predicted ATPase/class 3 adenylate cyclase